MHARADARPPARTDSLSHTNPSAESGEASSDRCLVHVITLQTRALDGSFALEKQKAKSTMRKKEVAQIAEGKKPFFKKQSEVRKEELGANLKIAGAIVDMRAHTLTHVATLSFCTHRRARTCTRADTTSTSPHFIPHAQSSSSVSALAASHCGRRGRRKHHSCSQCHPTAAQPPPPRTPRTRSSRAV
eukprot:5819274-Pleurochrysis_carterae.AAC.1